MEEHDLAPGASVLDVFTGSGVLGVSAALLGARAVTAIDVSRRAVLNARLNALLNGVRLRVLRGDLFAPVKGKRFDLVLANPPYLPGADDELPRRGSERAWEGGRSGRLLIDRFCAELGAYLSPGGSALLVHSSLCGEDLTRGALRKVGLEPEVLSRERGPLGPITEARAEMLERRGLLAPGEREEEMLVFRAHPVFDGDGPL
jgi:release factor glutamine methyltransferase